MAQTTTKTAMDDESSGPGQRKSDRDPTSQVPQSSYKDRPEESKKTPKGEKVNKG